jgi:tetratricopeptide (TPR) repeat protein
MMLASLLAQLLVPGAEAGTATASPGLETRIFDAVYDSARREDARALQHKLHLNHHEFTIQEQPQRTVIKDDTARIRFVITADRTQSPDSDLDGMLALEKLYPYDAALLMKIMSVYRSRQSWAKAYEYMENSRKAAKNAKADTTRSQLVGPTLAAELAKDSDAVDSFEKGSLEYGLKRYEQSIADLTHTIKLKPFYATTYMILSNAYIALGKKADYERNRLKLREIESTHVLEPNLINPAFREEGRIQAWASKNKGFEHTIAETGVALKKYPQFYALNVLRANYELQLGEYQAALNDYKIASQHAPSAAYLRAEIKHVEQLRRNGAPPYGDLKRISPETQFTVADWQHQSASHLVAAHKGDMRIYEAICEALTAHGEAFSKQDLKEARAEIEKMLSVVPLKNRSELGSYYTAGRPDKDVVNDCTDYIENVHEKFASIVSAYSNRARAYGNLKDYARAIKDYSVLLLLSPKSAAYFKDRGDCYLALKKFKEAAEDYTRAIANDADQSSATYKQRSIAYDALNMKELASKDRKIAEESAETSEAR